ncbi:MAG: META domain-containing protein [Bacteroidota bacterium]
MKSSAKYFAFFLLPCLLLLACAPEKQKNGQYVKPLLGTSWQLLSMSGKAVAGLGIEMHFEADKVNGKAVCNRYFSDYTTKVGKINFSSIGSTKMMCPEDSQLEVEYYKYLRHAHRYEHNDQQLTLHTSQGALVYQVAPKQ